MMQKIILMLIASACIGGFAITDERIAFRLRDSLDYNHGHVQRYMMNCLLKECDYDSNRVARVAKVLVTNDYERALFYIGYIGRYGTTNDVPFLESYVTNAECGYNACNSILRLSGLNSNSLHCASLYNSLTNETIRSCDLFNVIVKWSNRDDISDENKSLGMDYAWNFASNATFLTEYIDLTFREYLPSYTNGTTRSDFLNHRLTLGISTIDRAYIFNVLEHIQNEPDWILNRPRSNH